ncbi:hypothetical protein [Lacticaseibacillus mingshuiensis]|uniref:hypothetical protein n=1 Tax=Lacticaseibacillus mingshuiensis TaxID=2799574 RepID=UPI00194FCF26|nr:hypothetical protein [Lacticaseibacillus mingshuiensis]
MQWTSILYIVVFIVAAVAVGLFRRQVVYAARARRGWRIFYLVAAGLILAMTLVISKTVDEYVSGFFICGMFLIFAFWQRGLTTSAVINGLGSVRAYRTFSAIRLQADGTSGTRMQAMVGSVTVVKMRFKDDPKFVAKFLKRRMDPQRVIIVQ